MPKSAYIHIPFCKSKCKYCSFISTENVLMTNEYINTLLKEIDNFYNSETLNTLYFGGGTPSLLNIKHIENLMSKFHISNETEITFEINPDDTGLGYLKNLKSLGINRLSFGVQTFNNDILNYIGRRHDTKTALNAVYNAKNVGFENISIDLIYGLPFQTMNVIEKDLAIVKNLSLTHISTYGLKIEPLSFFYNNPPKNLPDEDAQADMYLYINKYLENIGLMQYEISNFSKKGYESKHNLNYWNNSEYYGFGLAAHGYKDGIRYSNFINIDEYIKNPLLHREQHFVTEKEKLEEEIFLGFRREKGIDLKEINNKFNIDFNIKYKKILEKYLPDYIVKTKNGYKLNANGILLSNNILADFLD